MARTTGNVVDLREHQVAGGAGRSRARLEAETGAEPRLFPMAANRPQLPAMIPDEILDFYGFLFCQGGFRKLGMTFEGFLSVIAAVKPANLSFDSSDAQD